MLECSFASLFTSLLSFSRGTWAVQKYTCPRS
uniref:Uncharacterized protein n=1 Tax=Anguilla anguilla TaxID=7936 RepID=A0A0E9VCL2_ANGAN